MQNASIVFNCNIPLYIEKNPVEKLSKVLEMEIELYTPADAKFPFAEIKFTVLHYIQQAFIRQHPGLSEDQINMLKSVVINCLL